MIDSLVISFDSSENDLAAITVFRKDKVVKTVVGEQADLLYYALTNQDVEICLKEERRE